jgi:hypothetical protein
LSLEAFREVDVKSDPLVSEFYFHDGSPSTTATETDGAPGYGIAGGFTNVPAGMVTLIATPRAVGKPSSHATVLVRAGAITFANLNPTPTP